MYLPIVEVDMEMETEEAAPCILGIEVPEHPGSLPSSIATFDEQ